MLTISIQRQVYLCFVAGRKDSSLHSSWHDFEAWYREMYRKRWTVKALRMDLWYGGNGRGGWCAKALAKIICIFFFSILLHGKHGLTIYTTNRLHDKEGFPSCPLTSSPNRSCNFMKTYCRRGDYRRAARPRNFPRQKKREDIFFFLFS